MQFVYEVTRYLFLISILVVVFLVSLIGLFKGTCGEAIISILLRLSLNRRKYHIIDNVTLKTPDGTTQIDHIVVSRKGVFVIETKNMSGWIFGSEKQVEWTQSFPSKRKYKFKNPIHQNYKHTCPLPH